MFFTPEEFLVFKSKRVNKDGLVNKLFSLCFCCCCSSYTVFSWMALINEKFGSKIDMGTFHRKLNQKVKPGPSSIYRVDQSIKKLHY